jgi:hypothetical protein
MARSHFIITQSPCTGIESRRESGCKSPAENSENLSPINALVSDGK